jgi:beta-galactosidase
LVFLFTNTVAMDGVMLMPRQNDRDHLGDVRSFQIETSDNGTNWSMVAGGELASSWDPQTIRFEQTVVARQLRFTALSGFGNDTSASLAELAVIYAGPKLPENADDGGQYKRVRSTSSDVDEGGVR